MKLRPWIERHARSGEWLVGIRVQLGFDLLARLVRRRRPKPTDPPNPKKP